MELKIENVKGKNLNYIRISVDEGYCFYDKENNSSKKEYTNEIILSLINSQNIKDRFIVVKGNADELNKRGE